MDRIIEIKVNGNYLTKDNKVGGVQHEANVTNLRIEFDAGWDGYAKKVTFWDANGENPVERTLTADLLEDITESLRIYLCPIPGEALAESGECTFIIDGYMDGKRQRSISDTLIVREAPFISQAGQPADPTPSQAEQLQVQIDTLMGDITEQATIATNHAANAAASAQSSADSATAANTAKVAAQTAQKQAESARDTANYHASTALDYVNQAKTQVILAKSQAERAQDEAERAEQYAETANIKSESWAEGGTGTREDEETNNAKYWAGYAQAQAESVTVPAAEGVYNVVLQDRAVASDRYALIVENGVLKLLGVKNTLDAATPTLIDTSSGTGWKLAVDNGKLLIEEV